MNEAKPASDCTVEGCVLPSWDALAKKNFAELNPLERLIYNNEPAGVQNSDLFRRELSEAIKYLMRQNASLTLSGDAEGIHKNDEPE